MRSKNNDTLDVLQVLQKDLESKLDENKQNISRHWSNLFTTPQADTKVQHWVNQAEKAVALYDGFMMAYKLIHRFNFFVSAFRRKKK